MVITNGRSDISTITMVSWFIIKLVCNKLKTMVYGRYIYSIRGRFSATYNWGTTLYGFIPLYLLVYMDMLGRILDILARWIMENGDSIWIMDDFWDNG